MFQGFFRWAPGFVALLCAVPVAQAQSGGVVNALCSTDAPWCEAAAREFTRQTGIKVNQSHKGTGEIAAQLRAESANPKTDIWWGGTGDPFLQAAEEGVLEAYRPAYINDLRDWSVRQYAMSGNRVGGFYSSAIGFGYNTEVLRKKKLPEPKCWADLIRPEFKGEVEISHPATSGTAYTVLATLVQIMGEEAAFDYLQKLHKNTIQYTRSGQAQAPNVAKGEVGVGVKGARNASNAQKYYDWLMSPAGQKVGAQVGSLQVPANKTFTMDPRIPSLDSVKLIKYDFEKYGKAAERRRLLERWTKDVEAQPR